MEKNIESLYNKPLSLINQTIKDTRWKIVSLFMFAPIGLKLFSKSVTTNSLTNISFNSLDCLEILIQMLLLGGLGIYGCIFSERWKRGKEFRNELFENTHTATIIINSSNGEIIDINQTACKFYDICKNKIKGSEMTKIFEDKDKNGILEWIEKANKGLEDTFYIDFQKNDGNFIKIKLTASPVTIKGDDYLYITVQDYSFFQVLEQQWQLLFNNAPDIIVWIDKNNGNVINCNQAGIKTLGKNEESIIGEKFIFWDEYLSELGDSNAIVDVKYLLDNGKIQWFEVNTSSCKIGDKTILQCYFRDITDSKNYIDKFVSANKRFELALNAANAGLWEWRITDDFIYVGSTWWNMLGYQDRAFSKIEKSEYLSKISNLPENDIFSKILLHLQKKDYTPFNQILPMFDKKGDIKQILVHGQITAFDDSLNPIIFTGINIDITNIKKLEEIRDNVERIMSHEFRNLLTSVIGYTKLLLKSPKNLTEKQINSLSIIYDAGKKLQLLVESTLDLMKLEQGKYILNIQSLNLIETLKDILSNCGNYCFQNNVKINLIINGSYNFDHVIYLNADKMILTHIIINLLKNAIEASGEGGEVKVSVFTLDDNLIVDIHNDMMVPDEIKENFFEKYVTKGKEKGTGLGTYIAKIGAKAHNGDVSMITSKESGTTVSVFIPHIIDMEKTNK